MITVKAIYGRGVITLLEPTKIEQYKQTLDEGQELELTFKNWEETRSGQAFRFFHVIVKRYADSLGLSQVWAKHELCINFGIALEYNDEFQPPDWSGHFVDYHGTIYFRKTTNEYKAGEMVQLIKGSIQALQDNGIDTEDLIIEHGEYWYDKRTQEV